VITGQNYGDARHRRGNSNFAWEISKILFGMLDNADAEYYGKQICHFEKNSENNTALPKGQTYVVRCTLGAFHDTIRYGIYRETEDRL
jgi:hypothetical protein